MNIHLFIKPCVFMLSFGVVTSTQASLVDFGIGMIYDDDINLTLLKDMNYAMTSGYDADGLMTWQEALVWADQLNFGGFDDWRLPSISPCRDENYLCEGAGELGHIYYDELAGTIDDYPEWIPPDLSLFENVMDGRYWASPEFDCCGIGYSTHAWWYSLSSGAQDSWPISGNLEYVWAVRDGSPVPVPAAIWLFGSGLLGLMAVTGRKTDLEYRQKK